MALIRTAPTLAEGDLESYAQSTAGNFHWDAAPERIWIENRTSDVMYIKLGADSDDPAAASDWHVSVTNAYHLDLMGMAFGKLSVYFGASAGTGLVHGTDFTILGFSRMANN